MITSYPTAHPTDLAVRRLIVAAGQAASVNNTQPWRFRVLHGELVELLADWDRWLRVSDPRGRSLHVSCGAALLNLRVAARAAGRTPGVRLLPDPDRRPDLLAVTQIGLRGRPSPESRELYDLIPVRRTNRMPFLDQPVPAPVLAELRAAAALERARLITLDRHAAMDVLDHAAIAEDELARDEEYLAELRAWTGGRGVPPYVQGPMAGGRVDPVRDFGRRRGEAAFEPYPRLAVLTTAGDGPLDWLRAGQALQRVLLVAAGRGVSASFLNQPLDLRDMRRRTDPRTRHGHPQMILRLGYGPVVARAPRRPVGDLVMAES
ncbi:Acg family FMN-binding oxidoreductase [Nonomuraea wenchangensis]|uniref:Acg family FMN-binding oxidoreductase n=1 Tax=Nonomuraea wenchangensis TaxID=568860 RepID=UPI0034408C1E